VQESINFAPLVFLIRFVEGAQRWALFLFLKKKNKIFLLKCFSYNIYIYLCFVKQLKIKIMKVVEFKKDGSYSKKNLNKSEKLLLWSARNEVRESRNAKEHECSDATCDEYIIAKYSKSESQIYFEVN
jgi:hypothetical protein